MNKINNPNYYMESNKIDALYNNLSYYDQYSGSLISFFLVNIIYIYLYFYYQILQQSQEIRNDWGNQRCNPKVIPFAGIINKPENKSILEYTQENWNYCIQNTLTAISGDALQPITYITQAISSIFSELAASIQNIRTMTSSIRTNVSNITENILARVLNLLVPLQQMMISFKDSMAKIQGILTAGLYTSLGTYYALKSVLGAIVEFIVLILIILVILIVGMWITPATWGMAISMSAVYASIAIPLAVIVAFMTNVLHVQSSAIPKLRCFCDPSIFNSCPDLIGIVTTSSENLKFFSLAGIMVSGSHLVQHPKNNTWIRVENHPDAIQSSSNQSLVYCPITKSKLFQYQKTVFSDWDEVFDTTKIPSDIGFNPNTPIPNKNGTYMYIKDIEVGDVLLNGIQVYGIVELFNTNKRHLLTNEGYFYLDYCQTVGDYNTIIDT